MSTSDVMHVILPICPEIHIRCVTTSKILVQRLYRLGKSTIYFSFSPCRLSCVILVCWIVSLCRNLARVATWLDIKVQV